jgi:hypothetical protein
VSVAALKRPRRHGIVAAGEPAIIVIVVLLAATKPLEN